VIRDNPQRIKIMSSRLTVPFRTAAINFPIFPIEYAYRFPFVNDSNARITGAFAAKIKVKSNCWPKKESPSKTDFLMS
jgi:hypothetical protein